MDVFVAEFVGTSLLLATGSGVVANVVLNQTKGNNGGWMVITTAWALGVFIGVVVAGPYSGAHLNPAVSVGLAIAGDFAWAMVPKYVLAQVLGAMFGSGIAWLVYKDHFDVTDDPEMKFAPFGTAPAIRNLPSNLFSEIIGTSVLIIVILYSTEPIIQDGADTPIGLGSLGALPVAFLVWVIGLSLGGTTGYAINPARDLGPRIMHQILPIKGKGTSDWAYSWVPILGPILGAALAAGIYLLLGAGGMV
ncbi:Glycerol uptake facilitator protein [Indibacter alkaliphilus LW1]|jgi:glycerol uptake facilitator protein|uniref:Glycerol uptake facilitator protein n=1 Tax=Indibacter alkaliphilus (strain CCUG 57479 / KCTC 22604 / LW1) TaxID=1189612 RepID=S2DL74_INDAL|nr:MIP/aquaporin family protein [Indibacter alkaliphilus]EOZ99697.1 Glycerol uptake facilitator protein [Indibacter alkaliphilus LW1]